MAHPGWAVLLWQRCPRFRVHRLNEFPLPGIHRASIIPCRNILRRPRTRGPRHTCSIALWARSAARSPIDFANIANASRSRPFTQSSLRQNLSTDHRFAFLARTHFANENQPPVTTVFTARYRHPAPGQSFVLKIEPDVLFPAAPPQSKFTTAGGAVPRSKSQRSARNTSSEVQ